MDDVIFNRYWLVISDVIMGLVGGKYVVDMINFKVGFMDFVLEEYYKEWLR